MEERTFLHIQMDAFFSSIEQRENPELKGKPVAVGSSDKRSGVIADPSVEAWRFKVRSAMATKVAKKKCSKLVIVPPRMKFYKKESARIFDILNTYTDSIEVVSLSHYLLDITEDKKGDMTATELAEALKNEIFVKTELKCSMGLSINKFMAKVASDYKRPNGFTVIYPKDVLHFVENLEIEKFDIILPTNIRKLKRLGIRLGRDLLKYSKRDLVLQFGSSAQKIYDIARGIDRRELNINTEL